MVERREEGGGGEERGTTFESFERGLGSVGRGREGVCEGIIGETGEEEESEGCGRIDVMIYMLSIRESRSEVREDGGKELRLRKAKGSAPSLRETTLFDLFLDLSDSEYSLYRVH